MKRSRPRSRRLPHRAPPRPLDLAGVRTYPLAARKSKVSLRDFGHPHSRGVRTSDFLDSLPRILAGNTLRSLASDIRRARSSGRPIVWGLGAHVLKVGLSPILIDLMDKGFVSGIALNGGQSFDGRARQSPVFSSVPIAARNPIHVRQTVLTPARSSAH